MIKGIIFDFNGVLIDDYKIQKEAWSQILKPIRGFDITDREMYDLRGTPTGKKIPLLVKNVKLDRKQIEELSRRKDLIIQSLFKKSSDVGLSRGLTSFLDVIKHKNLPMTIVSSASLDNLKVIFNRFKLHKWFELKDIVHKDTALDGLKIKNKPSPDPYLAGLKIIGVKPGECMVFEDAKNGIESARKAGINQIVVVNINPNHLANLIKIKGVIRGVQNFKEIKFNSLL